MTSDEKYLQYSEGEEIISAAGDNSWQLTASEIDTMVTIGSRIILNANKGIQDGAVKA